MKRLLLFLLFLPSILLHAQHVIREDCIGTTNNEEIIVTHENDDSSLTILYRKDGYIYADTFRQSGYKISMVKLDRNRNILFQKELDEIYYYPGAYYNVKFNTDGSFYFAAQSWDLISIGDYLQSVVVEKYDKNGNRIWKTGNLYSYENFPNLPDVITPKADGGCILHTLAYTEQHFLMSIDGNGDFQWENYFYTDTILNQQSYYGKEATIDMLQNDNNTYFISTYVRRYDWIAATVVSFACNLLLDNMGNRLQQDIISEPNRNRLNQFNIGKGNGLYGIAAYDSTYYFINTRDLSKSQINKPLGYPSNTAYGLPYPYKNNPVKTSACFFAKFSFDQSGISETINCTDSTLNTAWSYTFNNINNLGTDLMVYVLDDSTAYARGTLIRNGRKIWEASLHNETDTLFYKGNLYTYSSFNGNSTNPEIRNMFSSSKTDRNNINIFTTYSYYDNDINHYIFRLQNLDIYTGHIIDDIFTDDNIGNIEYFKSIGNGKAFAASTNFKTCHIGEGDVYLSVYSGNYNTITGIAYVDYNNNNTKENGEPIFPYGYVIVKSTNDTQTQHINQTYPFYFFVNTGAYNTTLQLYSNYYTFTPDQFTTQHAAYGHTDTLLFALHPKNNVNDISLSLTNLWMTRLGQNNGYKIIVENKGTAMANGKVKLLMDSRLLNISTNPNYAYRNGDTIVWNIGNLAPLHKGEATISFTGEVPAVLNAGDTIVSKAWYESDSTDVMPADNYAELKEIIRASYDPNDKAITSGETLTPQQVSNGSYISYIIHFQNKGNDTAFKIIVLDTLSENVDVNSLQIINASAPYTLEIIRKNILKFTFENIRLSFDTTNISSTGYISYKIKPNKNVSLESTIDNTAHICFDYNDPIKTNTVQTKIVLVSGISQTKNANRKMNIFPNPTNGIFTIRYESKGSSTIQLQMTDITGSIIYNESRQHQNKTEFTIDESSLAKGIYWIKLTDGKDIYSRAVIMQ